MSTSSKHTPLGRYLGALAALKAAPATSKEYAEMLEHARGLLRLWGLNEEEAPTDMTRELRRMDALEYHLEQEFPDASDELIQGVIFEAMGS